MKRVLLLLLGVAVAVGLAAYFVPGPAATVDGTSVSRTALAQDLSAIAGSSNYQCYLSERESLNAGRAVSVRLQGAPATSATSVFATTFVDGWLGQMVQAQVTANLVTAAGIHVTPGDLTVGRSVLDRRISAVLATYAQDAGSTTGCGGSGAAVLASVPAGFAAEQVAAQTDQSLLDARAAGAGLAGPQIAGYFDAHRGDFDKVCLSVIVVPTKAKAASLAQAINGGASFAQEARTSSIDSTTAANGGVAGCGVLAGTSLLDPLRRLALGQVSAPIAYNGSYLLAEVTSRTPTSFTAVQSTVMTVLLLAGQAKADAQIAAAIHGGHLAVDPRYGSLKAGTALVTPPASPPRTSILTARANTPGA